MRRGAAIACGVMTAAASGVAAAQWFAGAARVELRAPAWTRGDGAAAVGTIARPEAMPSGEVFVARPVEPLRVAAIEIEQRNESPDALASPARPTVAHRLRVVDAVEGGAIADALVTVEEEGVEKPIERRTDSEGRLTLHVAHGAHVVVRAPGRCGEAIWLAGTRSRAQQEERVVAMGTACTLAGRVVDADGAPVAKASVAAIGDFRAERLYRTYCSSRGELEGRDDLGRTDESGRFGPRVGRAGGSTAFLVETDTRSLVLPGRSLDVAGGSSIEVELRLPRIVELVVELADPHGVRAEWHSLDLLAERRFDLFGERWSTGRIGPDDKARIELAAAGPCRLRMRGQRSGPRRERERWVDLEVEAEVVVAPGTTTLRWNFPKPSGSAEAMPVLPLGSVVGTVACDCPAGETCGGVRVLLMAGGKRVAIVAPAVGGVFQSCGLPAGRYELLVGGGEHRLLPPRPIAVESGAVLRVGTLRVERRELRRGRIVDPDGRLLASIEFGVADDFANVREFARGASDADGRFTVPRFDGPCTLAVLDSAVGIHLSAPPSDPAEEWRVVVAAPRRVTGRVVVPDGIPPGIVHVEWWQSFDPGWDPDWVREHQLRLRRKFAVGSDGRFEIARAASHAFEFEVRCDPVGGYGTIATRSVPAGGDVDLGPWTIPAAR